MKKLLLGIILGMIAISIYNSESLKETPKQTGRVFEDARTEDGRIDLSFVIDSNKFSQERIEAFKFADADSDGFLTDEEYKNIPKESEFEFYRRANMELAGANSQSNSNSLQNGSSEFADFSPLNNELSEEEMSWLAEIDQYIAQTDPLWQNAESGNELGTLPFAHETNDVLAGLTQFEVEVKKNFESINQAPNCSIEWQSQHNQTHSGESFPFTFDLQQCQANIMAQNNSHCQHMTCQ